jgi:hypothetical protein
MTAPGEKNSLSHQTTWAVSTVLALFGFSDVLTVLVSSGIEQLLVIMRIAAPMHDRAAPTQFQL